MHSKRQPQQGSLWRPGGNERVDPNDAQSSHKLYRSLLRQESTKGQTARPDGFSYTRIRRRSLCPHATDYLPLQPHVRHYDNGNGKAHESQIGDAVGHAHRQQLRISLTTMRTGVRHYLPVVGKGLTFGKSCDHNPEEGDQQEPPDSLKPYLI